MLAAHMGLGARDLEARPPVLLTRLELLERQTIWGSRRLIMRAKAGRPLVSPPWREKMLTQRQLRETILRELQRHPPAARAVAGRCEH